MPYPEDQARENIDRMLSMSGWAVQDPGNVHLAAYRGLAIRNFTLKQGHGFADYLLYVDGQTAGVIGAKKEGVTLTGVETQSDKYTKGLPDGLPAWQQVASAFLSAHEYRHTPNRSRNRKSHCGPARRACLVIRNQRFNLRLGA